MLAPFLAGSLYSVLLLSLGGNNIFSFGFLFYLSCECDHFFYGVNQLLLLLYSSTIKSDPLAFYISSALLLRGVCDYDVAVFVLFMVT
jgi:hypothetical protein